MRFIPKKAVWIIYTVFTAAFAAFYYLIFAAQSSVTMAMNVGASEGLTAFFILSMLICGLFGIVSIAGINFAYYGSGWKETGFGHHPNNWVVQLIIEIVLLAVSIIATLLICAIVTDVYSGSEFLILDQNMYITVLLWPSLFCIAEIVCGTFLFSAPFRRFSLVKLVIDCKVKNN